MVSGSLGFNELLWHPDHGCRIVIDGHIFSGHVRSVFLNPLVFFNSIISCGNIV